MNTVGAFSGIANGRTFTILAGPFFAVLKTRLLFVIHNLRSTVGIEKALIKGSGRIGAGADTVPAADTAVVINFNNAVGPLPGRVGRTDLNAGRIITLHTGPRQKGLADIGIFAHLFLNHRPVNHPRRQMILRHAGRGTGGTAHTFGLVNNHGPMPLVYRFFQGSLQIVHHLLPDFMSFNINKSH